MREAPYFYIVRRTRFGNRIVLLRESRFQPHQGTTLMRYLVLATIGLFAIGYFVGSPDCRAQSGEGPKIADAIVIAGCPHTFQPPGAVVKKQNKPFSIS